MWFRTHLGQFTSRVSNAAIDHYPPRCAGSLGAVPAQADEARLRYVAMTRAIEVLVLSCDRRSGFVERIEGALERVG